MSKQKTHKVDPSTNIPEPKIVKFYSLVANEGGYRIAEISVDVSSFTIVGSQPATEPEVLAIAFNQLQRKLRNDLGV